MDFDVSKAQQPYFSGSEQKLMMMEVNNNNLEGKEGQSASNGNSVTSQLQIKSSGRSTSPEALDKKVVLRRLRSHKCKTKVKSAFQALVGIDSSGQAQEKWMELGDAFTCP